MSAVMELRNRYKDLFERTWRELGFMAFRQACCQALERFRRQRRDRRLDIVYKHFAISASPWNRQSLVVPVVRDADKMEIARIEKTIGALGKKAGGRLDIEELQGEPYDLQRRNLRLAHVDPILNAPQSGILGMHKIQERPVVINGKIEIRP